MNFHGTILINQIYVFCSNENNPIRNIEEGIVSCEVVIPINNGTYLRFDVSELVTKHFHDLKYSREELYSVLNNNYVATLKTLIPELTETIPVYLIQILENCIFDSLNFILNFHSPEVSET